MAEGMREHHVETALGRVSVLVDGPPDGVPMVFMHGVFLDRTLWTTCVGAVTGRTHVYLDMPAHGASSNVGRDWNLDECVEMLLRVLDELKIQRCLAVGHSWGGMTALRAASRAPERFAALALFNMPFRRNAGLRRLGFQLQKLVTVFPRFYARQAARALYSKRALEEHPEFSLAMQEWLSARPPREISRVIDAVLLQPGDVTRLLRELTVPALAVVGEEDYVGTPPGVDAIVVPGGHISPHEAPHETRFALERLLALARGTL
jgi:pimeloyl-ACP methyl ester carboxylesterase